MPRRNTRREQKKPAECVSTQPVRDSLPSRRGRRSRSLRASASFISTYTASARESPRKCSAFPTFHPAASRRAFFPLFMLACLVQDVVVVQSLLARADHIRRRESSLLAEDLRNHDRYMSNVT